MLTSIKDITFYEQVVNRLILQYNEYLYLSTQIKRLEDEKFALLVLKKDTKDIDEKIKLLSIDLVQTSNEMTFANPLVWMMYKFKAYKDTSNEIQTLGDFRKHCEPEGYICTERFTKMRSFLKEKLNVDVNDTEMFPDNMPLNDFYLSETILNLLTNNEFMMFWKSNEYLIKDNKINKWNINQ